MWFYIPICVGQTLNSFLEVKHVQETMCLCSSIAVKTINVPLNQFTAVPIHRHQCHQKWWSGDSQIQSHVFIRFDNTLHELHISTSQRLMISQSTYLFIAIAGKSPNFRWRFNIGKSMTIIINHLNFLGGPYLPIMFFLFHWISQPHWCHRLASRQTFSGLRPMSQRSCSANLGWLVTSTSRN